jgi:Flp pilus assembly protein TadB
MLDKKMPGKMIPDEPREPKAKVRLKVRKEVRPAAEVQAEVQQDVPEDIPAAGRPGSRSVLTGLLPGLALILVGVLFLLDNAGLLPGDDWWQYFLVGLGLVFIILSWVQYINPKRGRPRFWRILAGLALVATGLVFLFGFRDWWPVVLIVVGVALVLLFVLRRDRQERKEEEDQYPSQLP